MDSGGLNLGMDRYAEQLHLTMLAKAPEIILFAYNQLLGVKLSPRFRTPWQGMGTSFNYDEMTAPIRQKNGTSIEPTTMASSPTSLFMWRVMISCRIIWA